MSSATVTDTEPINEPPPGVILGVLIVLLKLVLPIDDRVDDDCADTRVLPPDIPLLVDATEALLGACACAKR